MHQRKQQDNTPLKTNKQNQPWLHDLRIWTAVHPFPTMWLQSKLRCPAYAKKWQKYQMRSFKKQTENTL